MDTHTRYWILAQRILFTIWVICGILVMQQVPAGFLTNYGADLTQPAWLYIVSRGLTHPGKRNVYSRIFGTSLELPAILIFVAGALTEFSQRYWPNGLFRGTFDPIDIVAFAVSITTVYAIDKYLVVKASKTARI